MMQITTKTPFTLPEGYNLIPIQSITVDTQKLYGGADISDHYDAEGTNFVLCDAEGPDKVFKLRGFKRRRGDARYTETPLLIEGPPGTIITGRGNCDVQWIDGKLHFSGWVAGAFFQGTIPEFVPFPSIPSLEKRIAALEAGGPPQGGGGSESFTMPPTPLISKTDPKTGVGLWEGRTITAGEWVDVPNAFGAPLRDKYLVRFVVQSTAANVRVRAGTEAAPFFLTANTQVPNMQMHTQGWAPAVEGRVWVSAVNGAAQVWFQVVGW